MVLNFSQMWALYCLVQFYNVTHEQLKPIKPLAKFISFKAIVFATWWQGVGIALLRELGVLPKEGKLETGLQDFLICIEVICFTFCVCQPNFLLKHVILRMYSQFKAVSVKKRKKKKESHIELCNILSYS